MNWTNYYKIENFVKEKVDNEKKFFLIIADSSIYKEDKVKQILKGLIELLDSEEMPHYFLDTKENKNEILKLFEGLRHLPIVLKFENGKITEAFPI